MSVNTRPLIERLFGISPKLLLGERAFDGRLIDATRLAPTGALPLTGALLPELVPGTPTAAPEVMSVTMPAVSMPLAVLAGCVPSVMV